MKINDKIDLLEEKYRPQILDDIILPQKEKEKFKEYIQKDKLPNILLISETPGLGKTTLVKILVNEMDCETKWINASKDNGVDVIRNTVENFCSSSSYNTKKKLVVMDESDSLTIGSKTAPGSQEILRGTIETYSTSSRFILTANYVERFIDPLLDRLTIFNFDEIMQNNKKEVGILMYNRLKYILENENIEYNDVDVKTIMMEHFPSMRAMTVAIERNNQNGKLVLTNSSVFSEYENIMKLVKEKSFIKVRSQIMILNNVTNFYTWFWKNLDKYVNPKQMPGIIIELSSAQDMNARAKNKQIPLMSFLTKMMKVM